MSTAVMAMIALYLLGGFAIALHLVPGNSSDEVQAGFLVLLWMLLWGALAAAAVLLLVCYVLGYVVLHWPRFTWARTRLRILRQKIKFSARNFFRQIFQSPH